MKKEPVKSFYVYPTTLGGDKNKESVSVIEQCYCPNGHSLVRGDIYFGDYQAISLNMKQKIQNSEVYLSPIIGNKCKVVFNNPINHKQVYEFHCPECNAKLPVFSPCSCGGELVALFLDPKLKLSNIAAFCSRLDCTHCEIKSPTKLKSIFI